MFETADKHSFHFDTVQMPINVMDAQFPLVSWFELFKTSSHYDGTIKNPSWLGYING
jgi:hypothetical protein